MKILIVGGAGYIGGVTSRLFEAAGHDVTVFDNLSTGHRFNLKSSRLNQGDMLDKSAVARLFIGEIYDAVLAFAAKIQVEESMREPYLYLSNNVFGPLAVVDEAVKAGVTNFIYSSSAAVYGEPSQVPLTESSAKQPINPYGASKWLMEQILASYQITHELNWVAFRYFNAAGGYEGIGPDYPVVTHLISRALIANQDGDELQVFGDDYDTKDGTCVRDYVHVEDIARAHVLAAEQMVSGKKLQQAMNLGSGQGYTILEVLEAVKKASGKPVPYKVASRRPGDPAMLIADASLAKRTLGWEPQHDLDAIVADALEWYVHKPTA